MGKVLNTGCDSQISVKQFLSSEVPLHWKESADVLIYLLLALVCGSWPMSMAQAGEVCAKTDGSAATSPDRSCVFRMPDRGVGNCITVVRPSELLSAS